MNVHRIPSALRFGLPNALTLANLLCGCIGLVGALNGGYAWAWWMILVAGILDFGDGAAARWLKAPSAMGKELDSLADLVSFGVLPACLGLVHARSLLPSYGASPWPTDASDPHYWPMEPWSNHPESWWLLAFAAIPLASAWRLARFNLEDGSTRFFSGLPTPAHAILWMSFLGSMPVWPAEILVGLKAWHLSGAALVGSSLLVSRWPLLSLKFESGATRLNYARWALLGLGLLAILVGGLAGLFLVMLFYFPYSFLIARFL
ncbi:MAG: CDP-alcohol phosphatidyltransferase family protein [Bacteroidia bacterium]